MKFTKLQKGVIAETFDTYQQAKEFFGLDSNILPVLSFNEWLKTPKDYRGYENGFPHVLYLTDKGTTYGKCLIVNEV